MAFTVTATPGGASFQNGVNLLVRVLTHATETGGATSGSNNTAAGIPQGSLTPNFSSSFVAFAISQDGVGTLGAAATNNTYDNNYNNGTQGWCTGHGHYTGTVTASTALTYGAGASGTGGTGADHENWCAYEIPASGGTVTVDGSSPAAVNQDSVTSITTASFNPPGGAVLVAMVTAGGTGTGAGMTCTITDSSGTGMVWTRRAVSSTSDNFQPTFIFTATLPTNLTPFTRTATAQTSRTWQRRWTRTVRPVIPPAVQQVTVHAGVATVAAAAVFPAGFRPFLYGLGGSGYNSWFTDRAGNPRLQLSEQAWALPWNAGRWNSGNWQSDYDTYFQTRSSQGYNSWYGIVWGNSHVDSTALSGGRTWDGIYPLNINGTPGAIATGSETITLNNSFWTRIDYFINSAMSNGITVFMNMSMSYDVSDVGGIWQHASNTQGTAFGTAVATRYPQVNYPNLQWFFGDDDDGPNNTFYQAILTGIQSTGDTRPLISNEQFTDTNCHIEFDNKTAFGGTFGPNNATYNWVYTYDPPYLGVEDSYTEGGTFTHIPPTYGDGVYYGDDSASTTTAQQQTIRHFAWWAIASGSRGVACTSGPSDLGGGGLWTWQSDAVSRLTSDPHGTFTTSTIGAIRTFIEGLADWNKLIPDTGNAFITAGRGTRGTSSAPGGVFNLGGSDTYVAGSITPAGTLAIIYCRASMSITINQSLMGAGYTATWVDPLSLATQSTTTGSTYASAGLGNNSAGDPDWVLVLQGAPITNATAGVAAVSVVANAPVPAVTVTAGVATVTAAVTAPAVTVKPNAGIPTVLTVANAPAVAETVTAGVGTVLVVANAPTVAEGVTAGVAIINAADPGATVSTSGGTTAVAGVAAVSVAAPDATVTVKPSAGAGAVLVQAAAPVPAEAVLAAVSTVLVTSPAPVAAETVIAGVGVINAADPGASVTTSAGTTANAAAAAVAAVAMAPVPKETVAAGAAVVLATGMNVPPKFVVARSTATVAATATSRPTVTDPRDGTPGVT